MIVSTPMAVLPVPRSPMISSRCPRPIGIIESMALRPACSGSFPHRRSTPPAASRSRARALARIAFLDRPVRAEEHGADLILLEVEDHADDVAGELQQLAGHGF